jgi:protein tyrosine/serine phosphatase
VNEVHTGIWIGGIRDVTVENLRQHRIGAILSLTGEGISTDSAEGLGVAAVNVHPLVDGANSLFDFKRAIRSLQTLITSHERVLVHCHAGRSRSPAVVAGWLVIHQGMNADVAMELIAKQRGINIAPELQKLVRRTYPGIT